MSLSLGVALPEQNEDLGPGICLEPQAAWDFAQGVEALGYDYIAVGDHVLGAETANRPNWAGMYDRNVPWHDSLIMLAYLAGATRRLRLLTGVLVLPQRQTALVAKQAADVDVLSGGRLWLGVSAGWNQVEFEALGQDFSNRGRRMDEQIAVLRALWTQEVVTFEGQWHKITEAGLSLMPVQRPIPLWIGGGAEAVLRRIGRFADGSMLSRAHEGVAYHPTGSSGYMNQEENARNDLLAWTTGALERIRGYAVEAGRAPATIQSMAQLRLTSGTPDDWRKRALEWQALGISHILVSTRRSSLKTVEDHLKVLQRFREELGEHLTYSV